MKLVPNPLTGWHVAAMFVGGFAVIIGVNLALAYNAIQTFPGIEVKNSYLGSQQFDTKREAQTALNWDVNAQIVGDELHLHILKEGRPVRAEIINALFGRATHTGQDQQLRFAFDGRKFVAPVVAGGGNWNLRLSALAADGTAFEQRVIVRNAK